MGQILSIMERITKLIKETLVWEEDFRKGIENFNFDAFNEIDILIERKLIIVDHNINLLRNFLDFFCDAVKHNFEELDNGYPFSQAKKDLHFLLLFFSKQVFDLPKDLLKRLNKLNS